MVVASAILPELISAVSAAIEDHADELTQLDQAIGDGDHLHNIQRGIHELLKESDALSRLDWQEAYLKIGTKILSSVGGASGSLYGTLFVTMGKAAQDKDVSDNFPAIFLSAVEAVGRRGKAGQGEKTMLDVLFPVAEVLRSSSGKLDSYEKIKATAIAGAEATRDMMATKGRASFLGERSRGHIDAGAKSSQIMICAIVDALRVQPERTG